MRPTTIERYALDRASSCDFLDELIDGRDKATVKRPCPRVDSVVIVGAVAVEDFVVIAGQVCQA